MLVFPLRPGCHFQAHVSGTDGFTLPAHRIVEGVLSVSRASLALEASA